MHSFLKTIRRASIKKIDYKPSYYLPMSLLQFSDNCEMTPNFQSETNESSGSWNLQNDSRSGFSLNQTREIGAIPNPTNFQQIDHKVSSLSNNLANSTNNIMFSQSMGNATENNLSSNAFSLFDSSAATLLSQNLSELNIRDDRPRPTKIRRRNALTILDQHFPNPNSMKNGNSSIIDAPTKDVDAFQGASLIQSLSDESIEQSGSYSAADWQHPKRYHIDMRNVFKEVTQIKRSPN